MTHGMIEHPDGRVEFVSGPIQLNVSDAPRRPFDIEPILRDLPSFEFEGTWQPGPPSIRPVFSTDRRKMRRLARRSGIPFSEFRQIRGQHNGTPFWIDSAESGPRRYVWPADYTLVAEPVLNED